MTTIVIIRHTSKSGGGRGVHRHHFHLPPGKHSQQSHESDGSIREDVVLPSNVGKVWDVSIGQI